MTEKKYLKQLQENYEMCINEAKKTNDWIEKYFLYVNAGIYTRLINEKLLKEKIEKGEKNNGKKNSN